MGMAKGWWMEAEWHASKDSSIWMAGQWCRTVYESGDGREPWFAKARKGTDREKAGTTEPCERVESEVRCRGKDGRAKAPEEGTSGETKHYRVTY